MAGVAVDGSPWVTGLQASGVGEQHAHAGCAAAIASRLLHLLTLIARTGYDMRW
jgi:hypothetical protein